MYLPILYYVWLNSKNLKHWHQFETDRKKETLRAAWSWPPENYLGVFKVQELISKFQRPICNYLQIVCKILTLMSNQLDYDGGPTLRTLIVLLNALIWAIALIAARKVLEYIRSKIYKEDLIYRSCLVNHILISHI